MLVGYLFALLLVLLLLLWFLLSPNYLSANVDEGHGKSAYFNSIYSTLLGQYAEVQMHKVSTQTVTLTVHRELFRLR